MLLKENKGIVGIFNNDSTLKKLPCAKIQTFDHSTRNALTLLSVSLQLKRQLFDSIHGWASSNSQYTGTVANKLI